MLFNNAKNTGITLKMSFNKHVDEINTLVKSDYPHAYQSNPIQLYCEQ